MLGLVEQFQIASEKEFKYRLAFVVGIMGMIFGGNCVQDKLIFQTESYTVFLVTVVVVVVQRGRCSGATEFVFAMTGSSTL